MEKEFSLLKEWLLTYIKNKDLFYNQIASIQEEGSKVVVTNKKSEQTTYLVLPRIAALDAAVLRENEKNRLVVVSLNTMENLDQTVKEWDKIAAYVYLSIMFVNPAAHAENKWFINPHHHAKIAPTNIKKSLLALYETTSPYR